ncbi:M48 family metallopeptidase [Thalassobius sp. S69A]|uniref:M48 family metallopeptidase n=1 Tax=unclassified Thalassovita TaxID=2619711 RepID=UPI000C5D14CE|nr:peptidase M48 [Paracoccaceae bacterium]
MLKLMPLLLALLYGVAMYRVSAWRTRKELDSKSTVLDDPELARVTDRLAAALEIPRVRVDIFEVDPVNALAAPDGRVFVTRGMIERYQRGDILPEEIASVIAHELGHVALGHTRRRMIDFSGQNALRTALGAMLSRFLPGIGGLIAGLMTRVLAAHLSRADEYEADEYASALMVKAGYGTGPQKDLFAKLDQMTGAHGAAGVAWLMSHPKSRDRIARIQQNERKWGISG